MNGLNTSPDVEVKRGLHGRSELRNLSFRLNQWRSKRESKVNATHADENSAMRTEYVHLLLDYRNKNAVLAKRTMTVLEAGTLNHRMQNSGMGWARKTGY